MLNRFSKDTAVLDDLLPLTVFDFIQVCRIKDLSFAFLQHRKVSAVHHAKETIIIIRNNKCNESFLHLFQYVHLFALLLVSLLLFLSTCLCMYL